MGELVVQAKVLTPQETPAVTLSTAVLEAAEAEELTLVTLPRMEEREALTSPTELGGLLTPGPVVLPLQLKAATAQEPLRTVEQAEAVGVLRAVDRVPEL